MLRGKDFAERLRTVRRASSLTQQTVAAALGVNRSTYTYYETGKSHPDIKMLARLADIFGVTTDELLGKHAAIPMFHDDSDLFDDPNTSRFSKLTTEEQILILQYRQLTEDQRREMTLKLHRTIEENNP